ncbi:MULTISPECIES: carbohydrate ABC transporter permease [Sodalis]|jgi:multiple sugar transport system permease protein|uniref:Carbohydrate ABC transporter membrane protein 2 (CUT1 family) n=1 Tax=Sodalis ligni TaxID=2697027 RepID=A0A4R1N755_9GAMM|nr:carbohydrate ABC transporter permease [Sodalis ligni]TCL02993.1 carbohydrate ABC transporter membrane protein 2 (CUT1 family) [Sodalis ligni]
MFERIKYLGRRTLFYLVLAVILLFFLLPIYWLVTMSLKNGIDAFAMPPKLWFHPILDNYREVLGNGDFIRAFGNSVLISLSATLLCLFTGALFAYGLVFFIERKGRAKQFVMSLRFAPVIMLVIPVYYLITTLGLTDSYWVLIVVYTVANVPFTILMITTFFEDIPPELREAALVDGASEWTVFLRVMLPLARTGLAASGVLTLFFIWNEFQIVLTLSGDSTQTLPVAITSFLTFQGTEWGPLTAAGTLVMLPMLVLGLLVQKHLVRGLTMGGVK